MNHILKRGDVTVIFEGSPSNQYVQGVAEVESFHLTEVIPFIGITKSPHGRDRTRYRREDLCPSPFLSADNPGKCAPILAHPPAHSAPA